jgi:hypothetical protein
VRLSNTTWDPVIAPKTELGADAGRQPHELDKRQKSETLTWALMQRILNVFVFGVFVGGVVGGCCR